MNNNLNFNPLNNNQNMNNQSLNKPSPSINNDYNKISPHMYKNENDMSNIIIKRILIGIIIVLVIALIATYFILSSKIKPCDNASLQSEVNELKNSNTALAKELYFRARDIVGDIYTDTTRICGPLNNELDDRGKEIVSEFNKSTNSKFITYQSLSTYIKSAFTENMANDLLSLNRFKSVDSNLYCSKSMRTKNNRYIDMEEFKLDKEDSDKMEFTVKEKYFADDESVECIDDCKYSYKENKFVIEDKNNHWLVSEFTLPY